MSLSRRAVLAVSAAVPLHGLTRETTGEAAILARIRPPVFPARDFSPHDFADINAAIDACTAAGGGRVVVPAGDWPTGPIVLKSRVNLHLEAGATLKFSQNPADYPLVLTRFEGVECMNYSPFIYAWGEKRHRHHRRRQARWPGRRQPLWDWDKGARDPAYGNAVAVLGQMAIDGVAVSLRVFGGAWRLRPNFIQPYRCRNVLIEGVTIVNFADVGNPSGAEPECHCPRRQIDSTGPNNDGCDPECCATC
ncbi:MAG: hypothetical protein WDN06_11630 [Asticcacaulis sp.]